MPLFPLDSPHLESTSVFTPHKLDNVLQITSFSAFAALPNQMLPANSNRFGPSLSNPDLSFQVEFKGDNVVVHRSGKSSLLDGA